MKTRGILRKPRYSSTFNQEDLGFVSPLTIDEANELWDSFASCKSTPSPSVEMRGILRKPRYTNNINPRTMDEAKDSFASCKSSSSLSHPRLQLHGSDLGDCEWLTYVDVQKLDTGIKPEAIAFFRKISRSKYTARKIQQKRRWRKYENDWLRDEAFCGLVELFKEPVQSSLDLDKAENKFDKPLFQALSQEFVEVEVTNDLPVVPDDGHEEATIADDELAGDYGSAEEAELVERTQTATQARVRRSPRIAALQRVDYSATRRSVRRSPRLARLPWVDYKE